MVEEKNSEEDIYYEEIIKKTKTGITIPKDLRDDLFQEDKDTYFRLTVPSSKDKIVLDILSKEEAHSLTKKQEQKRTDNDKNISTKTRKSKKEPKASDLPDPEWGKYFVYDFENKNKIQSILESAYYKFANDKSNFEDAMGRVKYALVSYLTSRKTENAKLYFAVLKFLIDVIEKFNYPDLIEWIHNKIVPNIESKFLYELALIELFSISMRLDKSGKAKEFVGEVLGHIDDYPKEEKYNIMNSFKQLVKEAKKFNLASDILNEIREKLKEYSDFFEEADYKIQIIELLEDLEFIEDAYELAEKLAKELPPESIKVKEVRKIKNRLKETPI